MRNFAQKKKARYTYVVKKKRIHIKSNEIRDLLKKGGRKDARKDFFELLRRAAKTPVSS